MFYSPKMLGKKGPMGTVWMAAHLEKEIKKNQIEKINITLCAERLLFPEAPIALRMSAHLLLGLVRIYAWKVENTSKLAKDCRRLLDKDYLADVHRALPQSITLPNNFQLDDIDLDDLADDAGGLDTHQKTFDQITLRSREENYVRFLIDKNDTSSTSNISTRGVGPVDDTLPPCSDHMQELITNAKSMEGASAPNNADEAESQFYDAYMDNQFKCAPNKNQDIPNENQSDEFHASPNENSNAVRGGFIPVELQLDVFPEEIILINQNVPRQSPQRNNDIPSPRSANTEQDKVELAVAPSPPHVKEKWKRKKQQFYFDRQTVLSNNWLKAQCSPILAVPVLLMLSVSNTGKFACLEEKKTYPPIIDEQPDMDPPLSPPHQFPDNEVVIEEPANPPVGFMQQSPHHDMGVVEEPPVNSPVGPSHLSPNHSISTEGPSRNPPPGNQYSFRNNDMYIEEPTINLPQSPTQVTLIDANEQPERLRFQEVNETMQGQSPPVDGSWNTPYSINSLFNSSSNALPIIEPEVVDSTHSSSAKHTWPVSQSPSTPSHERDTFRTPPLKRSAEREDLNFLETPPSVKAKRARIEDGNLSPSVLLENDSARREWNSWSARSIGMAKYLREHLDADPKVGDPNRNISLNHILDGKTRKNCARMFFETLGYRTE
ncbi:Double-strand-break repair protein rad21-like protein 1 [Rhynchospora pubera]|uniref:Double-strand-break repair protein rad21-like protein 1 n=1 Tax=Rhynchospora pubera TaxID=906938 RepID=A0AAV8EH17_9POAL|nr:Double-strand-break repair protein rad21-like protein 1 [Rhynchospora pubera]